MLENPTDPDIFLVQMVFVVGVVAFVVVVCLAQFYVS